MLRATSGNLSERIFAKLETVFVVGFASDKVVQEEMREFCQKSCRLNRKVICKMSPKKQISNIFRHHHDIELENLFQKTEALV